jgi:SAM-dependent methyltransferase
MTAARLPFVLPDRTRVMWANAAARDVWRPRIQAIGAAWREVEKLSVVEGIRRGALLFPTPGELPDLAAWSATRGLVALPLTREGAGGAYASTTAEFQEGRAWHYRVALTRLEDAATWLNAWRESDDATIGELLGFPACCRAHFVRYWTGEKWVDPTWPMALESGLSREVESLRGGLTRDVITAPASSPLGANILLRWLGVRAVPHLPCSLQCQATAGFAELLEGVGRRAGFGEEFDTLREMLAWPVEWSALHGIAEVRTPIAKISTRTDATKSTLVVRRLGSSYPTEGATGTVFPFQKPTVIPLTSLRSYRQAFERPAPTPAIVELEDATLWTDNGFSTRAGMEAAHATIVTAAGGDNAHRTALDLGCGNGRLLERLTDRRRLGVEIEPDRAARARARIGETGVVAIGDLTDPTTWPVDGDRLALVVLMPGRWLEVRHRGIPPSTLERLRAVASGLLVYAYGDWLTRYGSLEALTAAAGLAWDVVRERRQGDTAAALLRLS